jgi:ATP-dependent DNA helicase RecQ
VAEESWEGVDRGLFESLRTLRRIIAEERELPAFVVFGDATLRDLARIRPSTLQTMGRIPGIGERKLNELGERFITEIRDYCKERGLDTDLPLSSKPYVPAKTKQTSRAAYPYFDRGASAVEVAEALGVTEQTALSYLEDYIAEKRPASIDPWVDARVYRAVETTARRVGGSFLKPVFEALGGRVSYEKIRLVMKHAGLR